MTTLIRKTTIVDNIILIFINILLRLIREKVAGERGDKPSLVNNTATFLHVVVVFFLFFFLSSFAIGLAEKVFKISSLALIALICTVM